VIPLVEVVKNVVCPFCGCLCDDIEVMVEDGHIVGTKNACRIGHAKFMHFEGSVRYTEPLIRESKKEDFKKTDYDTAIEESARLLVESKLPLMYGFSSISCEAQREAILIGEKIGAIVDNTATV